MLFASTEFVLFFLLFFGIYAFAAKSARAKQAVIIGGSLLFYAASDYRYVPILLGMGLVDFLSARAIFRSNDERYRTRLMLLGVGVNIAVLAFFKYTNFLIGSGASLLVALGVHVQPRVLDIVLPVGISFYTFQGISYVVDVHRGTYKPPETPWAFFATLTFFPHLLSGPILRSSFFMPQVERLSGPTWDMARKGMILVVSGLVKKAVADRLAIPADNQFSRADSLSALDAWTGTLALMGQEYADFAGYTDVACGLSLMLGFRLPPNFNLPFLSVSPADFWRRWHISLSTWLRDYVYLPLQVRFRSALYANLMITWLIAGVWHGASWQAVRFGLYHGMLLVVTAWLAQRVQVDPDVPHWSQHRLVRNARIGLTFYLLCMGEVIFRLPTLSATWRFMRDLHAPTVASSFTRLRVTTFGLVIVALVGCHLLDYLVSRWMSTSEPSRRYWLLWPALALGLVFVELFGGATQAFIYFQF
jgi:D-alanyl-lipoteichoic acid acyltransferase DltB (MBOAT superfamily)